MSRILLLVGWVLVLLLPAAVAANDTSAKFTLCDADLNGDGTVNLSDIAIFAADYFSSEPVNPRSDLDGDGHMTLSDVHLIATAIGVTGC